tara:strand:- start:1948 stop:2151 length:204 start_codon:yes stop_codon:yes gene_type:complete
MKKIIWYEVFGAVDINDEECGTETKESFDTLKEAQDYMDKHKNEGLSIDEWEMNKDGSGVVKRKTIC